MSENEEVNGVELGSEEQDLLLDFIQALNGTIINLKRYPPGSSILKLALERGEKSLQSLFDYRPNFTLTDHERFLMVDDVVLGEKQQQKAYIQSFIQQINARNIRSISFKKGVTNEELIRFLTLLSDKPEKVKAIKDLGAALTKENITNIEVDKKVFVAIGKDQGIAKKTELERLAAGIGSSHGGPGGDGGISPDDIKDGTFLSFILQKIPMRNFDLKEDQMEKIKNSIDFDKLKDAKHVDFEKIGPMLAAAMENVLKLEDVDDLMVEDYDSVPTLTETDEERQERLKKKKETFDERDTKIEKLVETFRNLSKSIVSFDNPQVRAKLLNDFIKVVTNFKSFTLARILMSQLEAPQGVDIKSLILTGLSLQKKSRLVDVLLQQISRVVDGLSPEDFAFNVESLEESEELLVRVLKKLKGQEKAALGEKAQKALGMARLIKKEAKDSDSLLILKMRRLIGKQPQFFLQDNFLDNFTILVEKLQEAKRPDIVKKVLDKGAEIFQSSKQEHRIAAVNAFVRIQQDLYGAGHKGVIGETYNIMFKRLTQENDPQVFAMLLASIVNGFDRLISASQFNVASNLLNSMDRLKNSLKNDPRGEILSEGLSRITMDHEVINSLLEPVVSEDEAVSDSAVKVLMAMPSKAVLPQMLKLLRSSDEMRVRKKCTNIISKFGESIVQPILQELNRDQPWYYIRNLVNLLTAFPKSDIIQTIENHMRHKDERVRKACVTALVKNGSKSAQQLLVNCLDETDQNILKTIVNYLGISGAKIAADPLKAKLSDKNYVEQNGSIASEMILAYSRIGSADAVDQMISMVKTGGLFGLFSKRNDEILVAVLKGLALRRDPKGAAFAKKFVRDKNPEIAKAAQQAVSGAG